jgi:predicted metal-dependent HD superfamily phosphohydrolase
MESVFTKIRNLSLEKTAHKFYSDQLAFHNFTHVEATIRFADQIINFYENRNPPIDCEIVYCALLFHDAGYVDNHTSLQFKSKESYSASIAKTILSQYEIPKNRIEKICSAILSTEKFAYCHTREESIVRGADLTAMAALYPDFLKMSIKIKEEQEFFSQSQIPWANWVKGSAEMLSHYLKESITLGQIFTPINGSTLFKSRLLRNIRLLLLEHPTPLGVDDFHPKNLV